jgi:menaquinone-dependent protoporphyrinogen oxidase
MNVLVAAASKHGATREIAEAVARSLLTAGVAADVRAIGDVGDPERYDAFVLGSAVYLGRWMEPARAFVERNGALLARRPVWLFSSGPVGDPPKPSPEEAVDVTEIVAATAARDHRVFAGRIDKRHLNVAERTVMLAVRGKEGDFRHWDEITRWATGIAAELRT